jgi:hypothetical protein
MRPVLRPGDEIEIQAVRPEELRLGDLVALLGLGGGVLVHRLMARRAAPGGGVSLVVKGDALGAADEPQPVARLLRDGAARQDHRRPVWILCDRLAGLLGTAVLLTSWQLRFFAGRQPPRPGSATRSGSGQLGTARE